jgi:glycosyltransferase involved in cell wall biosynthesis
MGRIAIDMSPIIHSSRAVSHCTACMASELLNYKDIEFNLLYFDYKFHTQKYLRPLGECVTEKVVPVPYRLLIPTWRRLSWPYLEMFSPECDFLYANDFYFPPTKKALVLATIHGLAYRLIPEKMSPRTAQSLDQGLSFILQNADYLVAVSETTKMELISRVGVAPERIYVVSHGVDKKFRKQENMEEVWDRLNNNCGLNRHYILYVGAIGMHKNVMGILSAYERLAGDLPHDLVLVGPPDSAWDSAHRFVTERNLSGKVHFLGYVANIGNNLVDLYNGADLFVFPSFYEGWTSPPLEAMACGTPVITSNCSSLPETVGSAAMQIDPNKPDELADAMEMVLSDEMLQSELSKKGSEHIAIHTWENAAAKLVDVFADIRARGPWKS